jgi:50S ribosomal protein L16 3-hydroxylase
MRRHWQKSPAGASGHCRYQLFLSCAALAKLAARKGVESRLIVQKDQGWTLKKGPFAPESASAWPARLLVQGICMVGRSCVIAAVSFRL